MDLLLLIGRLIYGGFFLYNGLNHFKNTDSLADYAASKQVPMPRTGVYVSGAMFILAGVGLILGIMIRWSLVLIIIALGIISYKMHDFWNITDPQAKASALTDFTKNAALIGAALMMFSILEPWEYSL